MANPLPPSLATGTLGELLVQFRLLQLGVQAAPPLKDTGNDLVAFRNQQIRTIQVKCAPNKISGDRRLPKHYDILAIVWLHGEAARLEADASRIFLIPASAEPNLKRSLSELSDFELRFNEPEVANSLLDRVFADSNGSSHQSPIGGGSVW